MRHAIISRHRSPNSNDAVIYAFPFKTMPDVISHVHPKFAILELGRKLSSYPTVSELRMWYPELIPFISDIVTLFSAWTSNIPMDALENPSYVPFVTDDDILENGARTPPRRLCVPESKETNPNAYNPDTDNTCSSPHLQRLQPKCKLKMTRKTRKVSDSTGTSPHRVKCPL